MQIFSFHEQQQQGHLATCSKHFKNSGMTQVLYLVGFCNIHSGAKQITVIKEKVLKCNWKVLLCVGV